MKVTAKITGYEHTCLRCGHRWDSFNEHPACCSRCKSSRWDTPITQPDKGPPRWRKWNAAGEQIGKKVESK